MICSGSDFPVWWGMEPFLNAVWLGLSLAFAVLAWRSRHPGARRSTFYPALLCLCVLVFPVISASDDLFTCQNIAEDTAAAARLSLKAVSGEDAGTRFDYALPQVTAAGAAAPCFMVIGEAEILLSAESTDLLARGCGQRAPPALLS